MVTLLNQIPHQYAVVNQAFNLVVPANTFSGEGLTITARVAHSNTTSINLAYFWLNFNPITKTFSGTPGTNFTDRMSLQIEVLAEDKQGNKAKAYFVIVVYPEGSTCTTVLPRTSAEANHVITEADIPADRIYDASGIGNGETVGFKGLLGKIEIRNSNGTEAEPILYTNVDGMAEFHADSPDQKGLNIHRSNHFKLIGQFIETDPFNDNIRGIKAHSGSSANKVLDARTADPSFNFGSNGGGTAIEIEGNCYNGIEVAYVDSPYAGSAALKIRNKLDEIFFEAAAGNNSGNTTFVQSGNINTLLSESGFLRIEGDVYEYSSFNGNTFQLTSPLTKNYAAGVGCSSLTGIRGFHDQSQVIVGFCRLRYADTENLYLGEGFYEGRFAVKWEADGATNTAGSTSLKLRSVDFGSTANGRGKVLQTGWVTIDDKVHYEYTAYDEATQTITLATPLAEDVADNEKVTINIYPHDIRQVRVMWNISEYAGYEGLQVKNCVEDCIISNNLLWVNSYREQSAQQFMLFIDACTTGELSNNFCFSSAGTGAVFIAVVLSK